MSKLGHRFPPLPPMPFALFAIPPELFVPLLTYPGTTGVLSMMDKDACNANPSIAQQVGASPETVYRSHLGGSRPERVCCGSGWVAKSWQVCTAASVSHSAIVGRSATAPSAAARQVPAQEVTGILLLQLLHHHLFDCAPLRSHSSSSPCCD